MRFWLTCQLIPDVLALVCGMFDFDRNIINQGLPDLIKNALPAMPLDAEFIAEVMRQLPDQELMTRLAENVYAGEDFPSVAIGRFRDSLNWTMEIEQPDE